MAQRAQPAQHRSHQGTHQRAVAKGKAYGVRRCRPLLELVVERPAAAQHALENVGSDAPRGQAGYINAGIGTGHARHLARNSRRQRGPRASAPGAAISSAAARTAPRVSPTSGIGGRSRARPAAGTDFPRQSLQRGDAILGRWMGGEQVVHAAFAGWDSAVSFGTASATLEILTSAFRAGGENSRQCIEKRMGTVRSSCACGMFAGNAGSGSARMIISMTSLSRSGWPELRAIWRAST
jgi:hypothetical protein